MLSSLFFALRRTWAIPLRTILALVTCSLAWFVVLSAQFEARELERRATRAGELAGEAGYRLEMQRIRQREGVFLAAIIPAELLALTYRVAHGRIVQLKNPQKLSLPDRTKSALMTMIFYDPPSDRASRAHDGEFPVCSLIQAPQRWDSSKFVVLVKSNWRCKVVPLPESLDLLRFDRTQPALALPMSAMNETVGQVEREAVEVIWFGQSNSHAMEPILTWSRGEKGSSISLSRIGRELARDSYSLSDATKRWVIAAAVLLACGVSLYVHGTYGKMRRELGLRLCVGIPISTTFSWLAFDIGTQVLNLAGISFLIAFALRLSASKFSLSSVLGLFFLFTGLLLAVIAVFSLIVVVIAAKGKFLSKMLAE